MVEIACVVEGRNRLGESPVWRMREKALYWIDSRGPSVYRLTPSNGAVESRRLPEVTGSICLREQGGLIVAMQSGLHAMDFESGILSPLVDPESDQPENRFNDGRCDRRGRFWAGTMNDTRRDPTGALYRFDPDHSIHRVRDDIIVPNSICWSPDDRTMYFADTYRDMLLRFDFDADDGAISNPVQIADTSSTAGRPDGSTVDAQGYLWNAMFGGGRLVRYAPDGRVDREIALPVTQPSSCSFGGDGLTILYVTSATQRLSEQDLARQPLAGGLFALDVGVSGLPEPEFAG